MFINTVRADLKRPRFIVRTGAACVAINYNPDASRAV